MLATKVSGRSDRITWLRDGGETPIIDRKNIIQSVEKSLERLGTDHIDLLQLHWPDRYVSLFGGPAWDEANVYDSVPFEEQLDAMNELEKSGKVRFFGLSNETSWGVCKFQQLDEASPGTRPKMVSIQNSYSLLVRVPFETDLAEVCSNTNVSLLAYSPLAGGSLTGKYLGREAPAGARFSLFPGYMERFNQSQARKAVERYVQIAADHGMSPTTMALAFCKRRWQVASTIIGATTMEQLKENIDAFAVDLTDECMVSIQACYSEFRDPAVR